MWDSTFDGVHHLQDGDGSTRITIEEGLDACHLTMCYTYSSSPFTPAKDYIGTLEDCKKEGESWSKA